MELKINLKVLKIAMLSKGYSLTTLSKCSGLSKATISRAFNQSSISRYETIYKIAKALEVDVEKLVTE